MHMGGRKPGRITANIGWMTFDKVFLMILNLLVTVRIANHFGASEYGTYQYAVSVVAIFEILVTFVDGRIVKKQYLEKDPDVVVASATFSRLLFSAVSCVIGIGFIFIYNGGNAFSVMFAVLLLNAIVTNLRFGMSNRFEYLLKSKKTVIAADSAAFLGALLQLAAVSLDLSIISISVIALISSLVNLAILYVQYRMEFGNGVKARPDRSLVIRMTKESLPFAVAASCATIYNRCDSIMLGSMMTTAQVGIYAISVKLVSVVQIVLTPIRESVYPKLIQLYSSDKRAYERMYIQISSIMTWIYICGVVLSFVVLPVLFRFLNEEYQAAFPVYQVLVLGTFFMYNAGLRAGHFTLINRGSILTWSQLISVGVNICMNYFGIKAFGMYGAAMATAVTQGISLLVSNLFFGKEGREVFVWQIKALNPAYISGGIKIFRDGNK